LHTFIENKFIEINNCEISLTFYLKISNRFKLECSFPTWKGIRLLEQNPLSRDTKYTVVILHNHVLRNDDMACFMLSGHLV